MSTKTVAPKGEGAQRRARRLALGLSVVLAGGCAYFTDAKTKMEEAALAEDAGDEARAEELYREVMRSKKGTDAEDARRALVSLLLGRASKMMESDPDTALPIYREALSLSPNLDEPRIAYARALMKVERYTEAIDVLMENKDCRGCKSLVAVIYIERGHAGIRNGDYADALSDYDQALAMQRDPLTVLAKLEAYIQGSYGEAADAVAFLDQALRLMPIDQIGVQQVWWDKRQEVLYHAATRGEHGALNSILALQDPRARVDEHQKLIDLLNLRMYAASLQIYMRAYDEGTQRGLATFADAEKQLSGAELESLRQTLLGLFMQRVAAHIAAGETREAIEFAKQALVLEDTNQTLNLQLIIATSMRNSGDARKMLADWESHPAYGRIRAVVETAYAAKMIEVGQFAAARKAIERAERAAPDLLETALARAELEAEVRLEGLRKVWVETFRADDPFSYPKARINAYGRSLAALRLAQSLYTDAAARDYLRGPQVATRMAALEQRIKAFYPYEAEWIGGEDCYVVVTREEGSGTKIKVTGPKKVHEAEVPDDGEAEVKLEASGLAIVETEAGTRKLLFAEPGVKIIVAL
ncbi:tetratricopeptide repeat protein [Pseudenhygromyxa sp. WMMC2535]|uniref:tetratricopeptide repeat protein n=1 Tax=Pseudenhygromyxa sp. WMMC2535 TaxID=2712867 RepID=UPI001551F9AA|nr:tetratricopeptide repeat protein [Pseudenhygromyxa sp. WMMC2535]NVB39925.1 tetratricopeptide repeat protein [Pseudenhygromyxa sp. WMMC2535]